MGTKIENMSHVAFEHIKGTDNILVESISYLQCIQLYDSLDSKGEEKEFTHDIFENTSPINTKTPAKKERKSLKVAPYTPTCT